MQHSFSITELCHALGVSRNGYHAAATRLPGRRKEANEQLLIRMYSIHTDRHTRCYGSPRMTRERQGLGLACSENRVARLHAFGRPARQARAWLDQSYEPRPKTTAATQPMFAFT